MQAYDEALVKEREIDGDEEEENEDEETRFITSNRSSFYTSSERT